MQTQLEGGQERTRFVPPPPSMDQRDQYQFQGAAPAPSTSQTRHIGRDQSAGWGRAQGLQANSLGQARQMTCYHCRQPRNMRRKCHRRQRSHGTEAEHKEQPDM